MRRSVVGVLFIPRVEGNDTYMRERTFVAETAIWAKKIGGKFGLKMA